ncbi:MAG: protein kinase [Verrucomicrobiae bacterium]|nr:protein kinase [Verrucomicrobiae bacterium]
MGTSLASYVILQKIGHGGMGVVYLARHQSLERLAAVKFLAAHLSANTAFIDMFLREAKSAANLSHPNIVGVYDAGVDGDVYFFIMEYVRGQDLAMLQSQNGGALPVRDAVEYVRQAANALSYAHRKFIIHRDIKPENLMLTEDGVIKVGDLGLAKWAGDEDGAMTQAGFIVGSPYYISPERLRDSKCSDPRSDVYSLGATLFHLVTGKHPYEGTPPVIMSAHLKEPVPDPREARPDLDEELSRIIQKMMAKNEADRFQSMDEVEAALIAYQLNKYGSSPAYRGDTQSVDLPKVAVSSRWERLRSTLAVITTLACLGVLSWMLWLRSPKSLPAPASTPAPSVPRKPPASTAPAVPTPAPTPAVARPSRVEPSPSHAEQPRSYPANAASIADFNLENPGTASLDLLARASFSPDPPAICTTQIHRGSGPDQSDAWQTVFDVSKPSSYCASTVDTGEREVTGYDAITMKIRADPAGSAPVPLMVYIYTRKDSDENATRQKISVDSDWQTITIPLTSRLPIQAIGLSFQSEWGGSTSGTVFVDDISLRKKE